MSSLFPHTLAFSLAVAYHAVSILVQDHSYETIGGADVRSLLASRTIQAAVDVGGAKRLEQIFGGSVADGDVGVYTSVELYIDDLYQAGTTRRQSFFTYDGLNYRVVERGPWQAQTGQRVYLGRRHVEQG